MARMYVKWLSIKRCVGVLSLWCIQGMVALALPTMCCDTLASARATSVASDSSVTEKAPADSLGQRASRYEIRRSQFEKRWMRLIPSQATLQYAGSIGLMSVGVGWHYGKNDHWETDLLVGFVPRYHTEGVHTTFTIKERYVPWHCRLSRRWTLQPLTAGIFFNTISGDDFWKNLPDRYPKHYYGFSTKIRSNVFLGQRLRYHIPRNKRLLHQAVSIYYEISTCDLYIVSKATNKSYPWRQTLSLAFGARWEM